MDYNEVEILLAEDSMPDAEMTIYALKKAHLANNLVHVQDGAEALDFLFCRGEYEGRNKANTPKVILLDIKMPIIPWLYSFSHCLRRAVAIRKRIKHHDCRTIFFKVVR